MATRSDKFWVGDPPKTCDACDRAITTVFFDAALPSYGGSWGNVCPKCFLHAGATIGTGFGQKYEKQEDGTWRKTAG